jgi:hypothetical protein
MTILHILVTVFAGLGGSAVLLAAVAWLLKSALTAWIAKDAERFKEGLKADAEREIEKLKHSLQVIATEHQVRFSKMHERRAGFIEELYKKLTDLTLHGEQFVAGSRSVDEGRHQSEKFYDIQVELREVFLFTEQHRIYLPETVCALVDKHLGQLRDTVWTVRSHTDNDDDWRGPIPPHGPDFIQQSNDALTKAFKEFETDIPAARKLLEAEFRKMLGSEAR